MTLLGALCGRRDATGRDFPKQTDIRTETALAQTFLFDTANDDWLTIDQVADALGVSGASVRNWIKTGYLATNKKRHITRESFETFRDEIAGVEKLTTRANKSLVDDHDHQALRTRFSNELKCKGEMTGDQLSAEYESGLSNSFRNREGIYYTPSDIAGKFFESIPEDRSGLTFCDPCCGTGNFLIAALENGFSAADLYGFDTDETAVEIAKRRVRDKTGLDTDNIRVLDFLHEVIDNPKDAGSYDVVLTNPPWGKKFPKKEKEFLVSHLGGKKSTDASTLFFHAAVRVVTAGGYLGMLLPDAFFNVASFKEARDKVLSFRLLNVTDFGKPFRTLLTKAKGLVVQLESPAADGLVTCNTPIGQHQRSQRSFAANPKSILNFAASPVAADAIAHLLTVPHKTLTGNARWGLGIVTGNNKRFIREANAQGYIPVYKGCDISKRSLAAPSAFIPDDLSLYQQVAPLELYEAKDKLLYRFISSDLVFFHDTEQRFILNSANMLVLDEGFPITAQVLARFLNTNLINWLFKAMFETHKVLRSDLECLPIFTDFLVAENEFEEASLLDYLGIVEDGDGSYQVKR